MAFTLQNHSGVIFLTAQQLSSCPHLSHGFSTRKGGVSTPPYDTLNLGVGRGNDPAAVEENYRRFCAALGTDIHQVVLSKQVHETTVHTVTKADAGKGLWRERDYTADALITNVPGIPLVVFSADCGVLLLHDPVTRCIGACHAGWRGCAKGIVERVVQEMGRVYGAQAENLRAAIGAAIGPCCFETDDDVPNAMRKALGDEAEPYLKRQGVKWHVDLSGLNHRWLERAGVRPEHIDQCELCTACRPDLFWSHRKMGEARGAQIAMIALG